MVGTGKFSRVLWCKFLVIWFLVHLTINIFIFDFGLFSGKAALSSKATGKRNHLQHLSSPMLPASDWPVPRGGTKDTSVHSSGAV